jgi:hypothetical protein
MVAERLPSMVLSDSAIQCSSVWILRRLTAAGLKAYLEAGTSKRVVVIVYFELAA